MGNGLLSTTCELSEMREVSLYFPWGNLSWTYDGVGNRLTQIDGAGTSIYTYQTGSNRLTGITGPSPATFTYDSNGNTITENSTTYTYNQNQRLIHTIGTSIGDYLFNARGQRILKTVAGVITIYNYDKNGQLISEATADGTIQAEYIYLNNQLLAKIDATGTRYVHTDHLGTPMLMTDSTGIKIWEIETRPFGDNANITGTGSLNFRFPGQYYDAETGLNYNYFRDYNPNLGRYIEGDPIGIQNGANHIYFYVKNNPVSLTDPFGLKTQDGCCDQQKKQEGLSRCETTVRNLCLEKITVVDKNGKQIDKTAHCQRVVDKCKKGVEKACGCSDKKLEDKIKDSCPVGSPWKLWSDGLAITDWIDCANKIIDQNCK